MFASIIKMVFSLADFQKHSHYLKVVDWLEHTELIFLIVHTFVCKFGVVQVAAQGKKAL